MSDELPMWVKFLLAPLVSCGVLWGLGKVFGDMAPDWVFMGFSIMAVVGVSLEDINKRLEQLEKKDDPQP